MPDSVQCLMRRLLLFFDQRLSGSDEGGLIRVVSCSYRQQLSHLMEFSKSVGRDAEGLNDITLRWGEGRDGEIERGRTDLLLGHAVTFSSPRQTIIT